MNVTNDSTPNKEKNLFNFVISTTLSNVAIVAGDSDERYGTKSLKLNDLQTLYTLGQCTQDLTSDDCKGCLGDVIGNGIPWPYLGSVGGRVLYPSCNLRFELFQFYKDNENVTTPRNSHSSSGKRRNGPGAIALIVVLTIAPVILLFVGCYLLKRKSRKSFRSMLRENFGQESATLEPLQFDFAVIEAATNKFSNDNFIGKGGFGEVYKGTLLDGRQIAVKRLSRSSTQGAKEFKNEVLLIAKLQHRNLVTFIGFCLEEQEKILIYEYVPNKGLDHFLFDFQRTKFLSWLERYNIIRGIAHGILYLHEHSRLKVIHRDLKPSNILLDEDMIPKISDFGLARIVELNQDKGSTNRIVGTLGYMSPEYAMLGQFSEKSDVYSFGVMVLEIITGKKNVRSYESLVGDSFLSYVWRQWRDKIPLSILDSNIKGTYSEYEVIKCIHIGLLCVQQFPDARPTMVTIVSYLNNDFIELPTPQEPAFLFHDQMGAKGIPQDSSSSQSINSCTPLTTNDLSITEFLPR
ncbi:cysteine-rich receptor protein kinase [Trifolium repens]|nr:cysteine-rich receptor protein kinase [Trifolium repens]